MHPRNPLSFTIEPAASRKRPVRPGPTCTQRSSRLIAGAAALALALGGAACRDSGAPLDPRPDVVPVDLPQLTLQCGRLLPNERIDRGQAVTSCNGVAVLQVQDDQNVVLYDAAGASWTAPNTISRGTTLLRMQTDGNLVAVDSLDQALWISGTYNHPGAWLAIQDDCNLVIYSGPYPAAGVVLWESNTPCRAVAPATGRMVPGDQLWRDVAFTSSNGNVNLVVQRDQNVVLYRGGVPLWAAPGTVGTGTNRLTMQYDGNLVAYSRDGQPRWASGTAGNPGAWLALQDDCNLVLYRGPYPQTNGALWATMTSCGGAGGGSSITPGLRGDDYPYKNDPATFDPEACAADKWRFCKRNCTSFVAWRLNQVNGIPFTNQYGTRNPRDPNDKWGNAAQWAAHAAQLGYAVDNTPRVGDVAWWSSGHVAWVAAVSSDGRTVTVEDYNWSLTGKYRPKDVSTAEVSKFIHLR